MRTPTLFSVRRRVQAETWSEATKRVAGAVGDGALAVRFVHQLLDA